MTRYEILKALEEAEEKIKNIKDILQAKCEMADAMHCEEYKQVIEYYALWDISVSAFAAGAKLISIRDKIHISNQYPKCEDT